MSERVAITGARASSGYGEHVTRELATGLADEQRVVVAGGAYGIEGAAHRAVLAAAGQPIAVLATGLDRRYPAGHSELLDRVGDAGLLVSELPPGTAPTKHRFEARNRLMAALTSAVVIPEAGVRSGSFTTVRNARSLGRGVGAVPGPVTSVASTGPNELIKQGLASVITQASDVVALLDTDSTIPDVLNRAEFGRGHRIDRSGTGMPPRSI
ncbi:MULTISPECIES: DNA-processing protein DprA [unclassified Microbacterium]|uniref:DNA-processing protein DprA n=1 Tax=unclassified Microbacterium TaxID=2609290 RepID=UPI003015ADF4